MAQATFTIKRSQLRQGGNEGDGEFIRGVGMTKMANPEGLMCCLGCIFLSCGVPMDDLLNLDSPEDVLNHDESFFALPNVKLFASQQEDEYGDTRFVDTELTYDAININDDKHLTHEQREEELIKRFAQDNIELIFTD